jgi:PPK2 family polyphosphate:nucleotide phosphotransferase
MARSNNKIYVMEENNMGAIKDMRFDGNRELSLNEMKSDYTGGYKSKEEAEPKLRENISSMIEEQQKLFADGRYAMLFIFQAMDAAGKDGAISHVMSGLNPQGTQVFSFKQPSALEMSHDYLWRVNRNLPEKGKIGIFNRSYYEEVLVVRVHNLIEYEKIPEKFTDDIWDRRYRQINDYERYLYENGIIPVKFFLHVSKDEQKKRLLKRIDDKSKNWKFSEADIKERQYWDKYQECYEETINKTGSKHAPWYVIPSDEKWYARLLISTIILTTLKSLDLHYPQLDASQEAVLAKYRKLLEGEGNI